jgi:hypothetical protein
MFLGLRLFRLKGARWKGHGSGVFSCGANSRSTSLRWKNDENVFSGDVSLPEMVYHVKGKRLAICCDSRPTYVNANVASFVP